MNYIQTHNEFSKSINDSIDTTMDYSYTDILESMSIFQDNLLSSIDAKQTSLETEFDFKPKDSDIDEVSLNGLVKNPKFIRVLHDRALRLSGVENTDDYETFIQRSMRFALVRGEDKSDLSNPVYIMIQNKDDSNNRWGEIEIYKIHDEISNFYNILSSKTIELEYEGDNYIYSTSNSGNEWVLKNTNSSNDKFKKYLRREDLKNMVQTINGIKITVL